MSRFYAAHPQVNQPRCALTPWEKVGLGELRRNYPNGMTALFVGEREVTLYALDGQRVCAFTVPGEEDLPSIGFACAELVLGVVGDPFDGLPRPVSADVRKENEAAYERLYLSAKAHAAVPVWNRIPEIAGLQAPWRDVLYPVVEGEPSAATPWFWQSGFQNDGVNRYVRFFAGKTTPAITIEEAGGLVVDVSVYALQGSLSVRQFRWRQPIGHLGIRNTWAYAMIDAMLTAELCCGAEFASPEEGIAGSRVRDLVKSMYPARRKHILDWRASNGLLRGPAAEAKRHDPAAWAAERLRGMTDVLPNEAWSTFTYEEAAMPSYAFPHTSLSWQSEGDDEWYKYWEGDDEYVAARVAKIGKDFEWHIGAPSLNGWLEGGVVQSLEEAKLSAEKALKKYEVNSEKGGGVMSGNGIEKAGTGSLMLQGAEMGFASAVIESAAREVILEAGGDPENAALLHTTKCGIVLILKHVALPLGGENIPKRDFVERRVDMALTGVTATATYDVTQGIFKRVWPILSSLAADGPALLAMMAGMPEEQPTKARTGAKAAS